MIESYKDRVIDYDKPVYVYRNLTRKGVVFSIKQNGLVVGYSSNLFLKSASTKISHTARERIRQTKKRIVHAFIVGYIENSRNDVVCDTKIRYNPYENDEFIEVDNGRTVREMELVNFNINGVFIK